MNHHERLDCVLSGGKPDRLPVSFWRHFPVADQTPEELARCTLEYQQQYDFDFVKVTPSSSFCLKDWGASDVWRGNSEGTRDYQDYVVKKIDDLERIKIVNPKSGFYGKQLACLKLIHKNLDSTTPIIQTIFSPLAQIKNLVGKEHFMAFLRKYPEESKKVLQIITETTINFIQECYQIPIDGIFYAVQQAQYGIMNEVEFKEFGEKFDLLILETVKSLWLNILHIHGSDIMFDSLKMYPLQIINWHDRETFPSLSEARKSSEKVLCGGLHRLQTMTLGNPQTIKTEFQDSLQQTNGIRFILSTGCVLLLTTPEVNIRAAREVVNTQRATV